MSKSQRDILGIAPYAKAIVQAIDDFFQEPEEKREGSFNVLISAQWGVGKTFILRKIESGLQKKGFRTFMFNPWKYSQSLIAIKRKFLQNLHKKFGGKVNLDSLYEGIEGEKHRDIISEVAFISSALLRLVVYSFLISLLVFLLLIALKLIVPTPFDNFFYVFFSFLKIDSALKIQNYLLETSIVIGLLGALVPALKFIFENISIKTKRAEIDSVEQFEEIFSKIILQKRHATILGFIELIIKIFNRFWNDFLMWDIFFLSWLDDWKIKFLKRIRLITNELGTKAKNYIESQSLLKSVKDTVFSVAEIFLERVYKPFKVGVVDKMTASLNEDKYPKLAILIDDLDRCEENEVKNILDGFLTFFEKRNCAYVVTADHTVIEQYIAKQLNLEQGKSASSQDLYSTPKEYLHKIFNLNFLVPSPPKDNLQRFLDETARSCDLTTNKVIANLAYRFFNRNPRAIRRFYTKIKFNIDIAKNLINNPKIGKERKFVAQEVLKKPELGAKVIALEMATPKFFSLIIEDPQIAQDGDAGEQINQTKLYFDPKSNIQGRVKNWASIKEREEVAIAERILVSEPSLTKENIAYEMLISFSSSTHSDVQDTFDWPQIQQDMEKGNTIFSKVYKGTTEKGREIMRESALSRYKTFKSENKEDRHLFFKGMIELVQASYRKDESKNKVMEWGGAILNELGNEPVEQIAKIESSDYAKLFEVFQNNTTKEKEVLLKTLSTDPYRKPPIAENIFKISDLKGIKEEDGKPSQNAKNIIEKTSQAFRAVLDEQIDKDYSQILAEIFTTNYKAPEESIPQAHRFNYLNSLMILLARKENVEEIKQNLEFLKQPENNTVLSSVSQKTWGLVMSALDGEFINYLNDQTLQPYKLTILRGVNDQVSTWSLSNTLRLLEFLKPFFSSLPQAREQLNDEQKISIELLLKIITESEHRENTKIRKIVSEILTSLSRLLADEEKIKFIEFYKVNIESVKNITQLQDIKKEVEKIGFAQVVNLVNGKISSIEKLKKTKKSKRKPTRKKRKEVKKRKK